MMGVDDRGEGGVRCAAGIEPAGSRGESCDKGLDVGFGQQRVVRARCRSGRRWRACRRRSRPPRAPGKTPLDDDRRFAAEFKGDRHEMIARRAHHRAADVRAAGEDQMIEGERRKGGADLRPAGDYGDLLLGKNLAEHGGQKFGRLRREFGGLDDGAVPRRDGGRQRHEGQRQRIVPGRHDADDPERLIQHPRVARQEIDADAAAARPHPGSKIALQVIDALNQRDDLHDRRLIAGAVAEVRVDRRGEGLAPREKGALQLCKIGGPLRQSRRTLAQEAARCFSRIADNRTSSGMRAGAFMRNLRRLTRA